MMLAKGVCSNCGEKYKTVETRFGDRSYVVYRLKQCPCCGESCFTREHITKDSYEFRKRWNYNSRSAQDWREQKKELKRLLRVAKSYSAKGVDESYENLKRKYEAMVELVGREPTDEELDSMAENKE